MLVITRLDQVKLPSATNVVCLDRLSCRFSIVCCALPPKHREWESLIQLEDHGLKKTHQHLGLLWVMTHSRNDHDFSTHMDEKLRSRIYLSSSGYAAVPRYAIDLLPSFLEKIDMTWMVNFIVFQRRFSSLVRHPQVPKLLSLMTESVSTS